MADRNASNILDEKFLDIRAKLLEVAADFDRIDRAIDQQDSQLPSDHLAKRDKLNDAVRLLLSEGPDRAERLQILFSREYTADWRSDMQI